MSDHPEYNVARRPNAEDLPAQWKLLRCGRQKSESVMLVDEDFIGVYVHYWAGRTYPCVKDYCKPCTQNSVPRWRGYAAGITANPVRKVILEVTPSCIEEIDRVLKEKGSLRGLIARLERRNGKANGQLSIAFQSPTGFTVDLPRGPDVWGCLARIWRLTHESTLAGYEPDAAGAMAESGLTAAILARRDSSLAAQNGHTAADKR